LAHVQTDALQQAGVTAFRQQQPNATQFGTDITGLRDRQRRYTWKIHTDNSLSLSVLTATFQVNLGQPVFIEAKDDGGGGDKWSYRSCKAPVKSSPPTNRHPGFLQAGCPSCRPSNSVKALKGIGNGYRHSV